MEDELIRPGNFTIDRLIDMFSYLQIINEEKVEELLGIVKEQAKKWHWSKMSS